MALVGTGSAKTAPPDIITTLDSDGNVGWYTSIAIGADNNPIISYRDNTNGALEVVACDTRSGGPGRDSLDGGPGRDTCRSGTRTDRNCER